MIVLPWPPNELSPNSRKDRRHTTPQRTAYRAAGYILAVKAGFKGVDIHEPHLRITFYPPDRRKRDLDNMLAGIKAGLDGISQALGSDDSEWGLTIRKADAVKGGAVHVEIGVIGPNGFRALSGRAT